MSTVAVDGLVATPRERADLERREQHDPRRTVPRAARNIQNDVSETALTPAMFIAQHATTTANAMNQP